MAHYLHRFYDHQADLNTWNPYVRAEIQNGYRWSWFRVGSADNALDRSMLDLTNPMR